VAALSEPGGLGLDLLVSVTFLVQQRLPPGEQRLGLVTGRVAVEQRAPLVEQYAP
jgi:hypothetical protein